jgi:hypothetical protein
MLALTWGGATWTEVIIAAGALLTGIGLVITAVQVRDSRRARTVEIVRLLAERWDSDELVKARRLIARQPSFQGLKDSVKDASVQFSKDYYCYTGYLNFFEQVGASFNNDRSALVVVHDLLGSAIIDSWVVWDEVLSFVWPDQPTVGENFRQLADHIEKLRHPVPTWWDRFLTFMGPEA